MGKPTIRELKAYIQRVRVQVEKDLPSMAEQMADVAKKLAERNINEEGFGADYSTKEVPAFFFLHKELNARGKAEIKKRSKAKEGLTWGAFRAAQGLPDDHVTLNYSGEMWRGMFIVSSERKGDIFFANLGHTNKAGQDKMNWNAERYGDFIEKGLTDGNRDYLGRFVTELLLDSIKNA